MRRRWLPVAMALAATAAGAAFLLLPQAAALAQSKGDAARGATKAAACAGCHGPDGTAPLAGMPTLAGQQQEFLELQLILLREGLRDVPSMAPLLKGMPDRDIIDIAAYFSAMKPAAAGTVATPRDEKRYAQGAALSGAMGCGSCHMSDYSGQRQVPRISRQREDYLANALRQYRDNLRSGTDTSMNGVMYKAGDADIAALAHYLAHN